MNTTIKRTFAACIFAFAFLMTAAQSHALLLKEFYKLPLGDQGNMYVHKTNEIRDRLWSELDAKGNRKPLNVLRAQREYAKFIENLFNVRDARGIRVNYMELDRFVASHYVLNPEGHLEAAILQFTRKALDEKIAADKAKTNAAR